MRLRFVSLIGFALFAGAGDLGAAVLGLVDFESHSPTASYGSPVLTPGSIAFSESGVPFRVNEFNIPGGGSSFNFARISVAPTGQSLELNNVMLMLDFSPVPSSISEVSMEYRDLGGSENLQVNGSAVQIGNLETFSASVAPGVELYLTRTPIPGGVRGKMLIRGTISAIALGGQEFFIDNLRWSSCQ